MWQDTFYSSWSFKSYEGDGIVIKLILNPVKPVIEKYGVVLKP